MSKVAALLGFSQAYWEQNTKEFQFQNFSLTRSSAMALEGLRELTLLRKSAVSKSVVTEVSFEERGSRLEKYLLLLHDFVAKSGMLLDQNAQKQLSFDWSCPAVNPAFHSLQGVRLELAMVLMLYANCLREQGDCIVVRCCTLSAEDGATDFAAAANFFKRAAGVFAYVDANLLSQEEEAPSKLRQMLPNLVRAMMKASLGEAQAVVASRAEVRQSPPSLIASLHAGASDLFEGAAAELKPNSSQFAQRFRMFLALSSELHQIRGRRHVAALQSLEGHPGASIADLNDALRKLNDVKVAADTETRWRDIFNQESAEVSEKFPVYETERQVVSIERVAKTRSKMPDAKILVKPTDYEPPRQMVEVF